MEKYTLDPSHITLDEFYTLTRDKKIIPSRIMLQDQMEERFSKLKEAGSYLASPFPISDIPGIPFEYSEVLTSIGIRNTRDFFQKVQTGEARIDVSKKTGIPVARLKEIFSLTDLSRITGVGPVFARVVYLAGITSVKAFAQTEAESHYRACMNVIEKHGYAAGHFSSEDIQYCINYARVLCRINENNLKS